jgi:choline-sulfatase
LSGLNLLFITSDEFRGDCLGAQGLNPDIRTPHLDRLACEGVRFASHFTTFPKCVPARASLTTGRYCHTGGFRDIFNHLPAQQPDLLAHLLARGYETALFGKNHCWEHVLEASHTPPTLAPGQHGHRIAHHSWTPGFKEIYDDLKARCSPGEEARLRARQDPVQPIDLHWSDEAYTRQAIHFLETQRDRSRPFYLHINIEAPHPAYAVPEPWFSRHDPDHITPFPHEAPHPPSFPIEAMRAVRRTDLRNEAWLRRMQAAYYGMIERVDDQIGRILAALDQQGLRDQTLVVFLSDHGDFAGQYGLPEKWDTVFADCLLHVPCLMRGPGLPAGRVVDALSDHTDVAPTLCTLLGLDPWPGMHGHCLLPTLAGGAVRSAVFSEGGHEAALRAGVDPGLADGDKQETYARHPDAMARACCVRTATHKLVFREAGGHELYELATDRWELHNRIHDPALAPVRAELMERLLHWQLLTLPDQPQPRKIGA